MEWPSKELENYFNFLTKVYSVTIKHKYPFILSVVIEPEEFISLVIKDEWSIDMNIYFCIDWELQRREFPDSEGLGEKTVTVLLNLQQMVEKPKEILNKKIYPIMQINKEKYCEGIIKHTNP